MRTSYLHMYGGWIVRIALSLGLAALLLTASLAGADDKDTEKPKYTIKEVMKIVAGKDKLLAKVTDGKGTDEDNKKVLEAFEELHKNEPKAGKGSSEDWKKLTAAIVAASKDVVEGKEGAPAALKKAASCGDCHKVWK
jgi:hypothetical protein